MALENLLIKKGYNYNILNGIADLIRVLDVENNVVFVNKAMEETFKGNLDALTCKIDNSICNPIITSRSISTGQTIQRQEYIDGKYFSVKCSPIRDERGAIIGAVEVYRNVTLEKRLRREIVDKNMEMTKEINNAKNIQRGMLPKKGFYGNLKMNYYYEPKNALSGDIFDIFKVDSKHIAMYIADCVGHGFASSMITMTIKHGFKNINYEYLLSPAKALHELSKDFSALNLGLENYFTCFYLVYNLDTGVIEFANAGHSPCPLVIRDNTVHQLECEGYPISPIFKNKRYTTGKIDTFINDKILLLTDGVIEATDEANVQFGIERVVDVIKNNEQNGLSALEWELKRFMKTPRKDDITAVLLDIF